MFGRWTEEGIYFVTRLKDNADYKAVEEIVIPENRNILRDQIIEMSGFYSQQKCPFLILSGVLNCIKESFLSFSQDFYRIEHTIPIVEIGRKCRMIF